MSHYRSNLRDLEFNLFELHRIQDHLGSGPYADLDVDTVKDMLRELDRLAGAEWAESFVDADRIPTALEDGEVRLPESLKRSLRALFDGGWHRVGLSEDLGGVPVPPTVFWSGQALLLGGNATAVFYASGPMFARVLLEEGTDEQRELARMMIDREWAGTMVLTEPDAGSDVGAATTKARRVEGDIYHLEGVKRFITGGEHDTAENIIHFVLARTEEAPPGTKGLSMFIVPKYLIEPDGSLGARNGVVATNLEKKMGLKGSTTCELTFGMDEPAVGYLVGGVHDGIRQMFRVIEHARMTIGTKSASTLSTGYLNALEYARERVQGPDLARAADKTSPRVRIIEHPDVRRMLMRQKAYAEGLRALWMYAAFCQDRAILDPDDERFWDRRSDFLLPLVKGYSSEKAYELLATSLQVFGGSGYTQDYPIEQYIRDAKIDTLYEGTTAIQGLDLFFRKIVKDNGAAIGWLSGQIQQTLESELGGGRLKDERQLLATALQDVHGMLGAMTGFLMSADPNAENGDLRNVYKVGQNTTRLLMALGDVIVGWLLLRQAAVALDKLGSEVPANDQAFYEGKIAAARFFAHQVLPRLSAERSITEATDNALMEVPEAAF